MTTPTPAPVHSPTPEFVAHLEATLLSSMRAGIEDVRTRRPRLRARLQIAAALVAGLLLGSGAQLASAQVQESRTRTELERAAQLERELVTVRLGIAQLAHEQARRSFEAGATSRSSLLEAAAQVRAVEREIRQLDVKLMEIRATSAPPRDELWAPLVNGHDYVLDRLRVDALAAQERLAEAKGAVTDAQRRVEVGAAEAGVLSAAQADEAEAEHAFRVVAFKLKLREQAVTQKLAVDEVSRRLHEFEVVSSLEAVVRRIAAMEARFKLLRQRQAAGASTELDVKRAELELLELRVELSRLAQQRGAAGRR